ncbi:type IV pilin protein [Glaciecola sp. MH2013]|uniref:type IV pilin protein n=1 Tax=Glaciecola sp. MH2013 TaxID=2785524 RepID=UPI0018A02570|nr:type IV pilin protein [Glaciecola sp. MH2013]MBF7073789.1 type IV pilin protein [Glaciecola sp. MH2013]
MTQSTRPQGFTLIELMIVIAIIAVIAVIALPSFSSNVSKADRKAAISMLLTTKLQQESYRQENISYATAAQLGNPSVDYYTFSVENVSSTTFTLKLVANSSEKQANDTGCTTLTIDQSMNRSPASCW